MTVPSSRGLAAALALRHARAESARAEYAAAVRARRAAQTVLAVQEDELARADLAGPRWSAGTARRDLLSDAVGRARAAVSQAQVTEEVARRRWTVDRRSERVIERLVERVAAARTAAATRAEQAVVDEIAAVAHLRRVPQDATAPRALS